MVERLAKFVDMAELMRNLDSSIRFVNTRLEWVTEWKMAFYYSPSFCYEQHSGFVIAASKDRRVRRTKHITPIKSVRIVRMFSWPFK